MKKAFFIAASASLLAACTSPTQLIFSCDDPSVNIYIDEEFAGNSLVSYTFPKGVKSVVVKGNLDGREIYCRTYYKDAWSGSNVVDIPVLKDYEYSTKNYK